MERAKKSWELTDYIARTLIGDKEEKIVSAIKMDTVINLSPHDFEKKIKLNEAMTTAELTQFIDKEILKGSPNVELYQVEKHRRTAVPFATYILTLIAFAMASRKVRGGIGFHLFFGIAICGAYVIFLQFSTTFAVNGELSPLLSVWIPNLIFGLLSAYLLYSAPK